MNVTKEIKEELKDLLNVYIYSEAELADEELSELESLALSMQSYLDARNKRKMVSERLRMLKVKMEFCGGGDDE